MGAEDSSLKNVDVVQIPAAPVFGWSVGNYMERFFDGMREGRMMGVKCPECGRIYLPPRMICERCFAKNQEWVELPSRGTVESFTVAFVEVAEDGELADIDPPRVIAMVKHDGADTCIAAPVDGLEPEKAEVGMKVEAVLDPEAENALELLAGYRPAG